MVFLLDQENVAQHGLIGIKTLNSEDLIVTFVGDNNRLPYKVENMLNESGVQFEIQHAFVGTKNAIDYQLVTYLTHLINTKKDKSFVILSRDKGFEISVEYLRKNYPEVEVNRCSSIIEYQLRDFCKKDLNMNNNSSKQLFELLWSMRFSKLNNTKKKIKEQFPLIFPYIEPALEEILLYLRDLRLNDTSNDDFVSEFSGYIAEANTPQDTYSSMAKLFGISRKKNERYLKTIRRCIFRSTSFEDFEHRIKSDIELFEVNGIKRIDIPKKIRPFYTDYKKSIARKG